jgi:hypothetical protein
MANYTTKRKYSKKVAPVKKTVTKKAAPAPVKELSLLEKAVSWVKNFIK